MKPATSECFLFIGVVLIPPPPYYMLYNCHVIHVIFQTLKALCFLLYSPAWPHYFSGWLEDRGKLLCCSWKWTLTNEVRREKIWVVKWQESLSAWLFISQDSKRFSCEGWTQTCRWMLGFWQLFRWTTELKVLWSPFLAQDAEIENVTLWWSTCLTCVRLLVRFLEQHIISEKETQHWWLIRLRFISNLTWYFIISISFALALAQWTWVSSHCIIFVMEWHF